MLEYTGETGESRTVETQFKIITLCTYNVLCEYFYTRLLKRTHRSTNKYFNAHTSD